MIGIHKFLKLFKNKKKRQHHQDFVHSSGLAPIKAWVTGRKEGYIKPSFLISFTACVLIFSTGTSLAFADTGSQLRNQIQQLQKKRQSTLNQVQSAKGVLQTNQKQQSSLVKKVQNVESQIAVSNDKIQIKQNSIDATKASIQTLKDNIASLQKSIQQRKDLINNRARSVYLNGGSIGYLQLFLDSKNFYDLVNRVVFVNKIAQQDQTILKQQVSDNQNLQKDQQAMKVTLTQLNSDMANLQKMQASLDSEKKQEQTLLEQLQKKAANIKSTVSKEQQQAVILQQQVDTNKKALAAWEAQQRKELASSSNMIPKDIQSFVKDAQTLEASTGVPAAITLGQAILESDVGGHLSGLATLGKNLFGIKGTGPDGTIYLPTHEYIGGVELTLNAGFRRYNTYYQCMEDHAALLNLPRYQYFLKNAKTLSQYAYGIKDGGYATDPYYPTKLLTIIKEYGLAQYDMGSF